MFFFPSIPLWRTMTSLAGSCTHTRTHTIILLSLQEPHTQVYNTTPKQHRNVFGKWLWGSNCSDCRGFFSHLYSSKARNNYWVHYQLVCLMMLLFIVLSVNCKDTVKTLVLIFFNKKQWKIQIQSLLFFLIERVWNMGHCLFILFYFFIFGGGVVYLFCLGKCIRN